MDSWLGFLGPVVPSSRMAGFITIPGAFQCCPLWRFLVQDINELVSLTVSLHPLQDNVDLTKAVVMGHSFGGATAVLALVKEAQFK